MISWRRGATLTVAVLGGILLTAEMAWAHSLTIDVSFDGDDVVMAVYDPHGGGEVADARVLVTVPGEAKPLATGRTDPRGRFRFPDRKDADLLVVVETVDHRAERRITAEDRQGGGRTPSTGSPSHPGAVPWRDILLGLALIFAVASFLQILSLRRRVDALGSDRD